MSRIKTASIIQLASFGIASVYITLPESFILAVGFIGVCAFILLNFEAFKIKGWIKKLTLWADGVMGLMFLVTGISFVLRAYASETSFLFFGLHYLLSFLLLAFEGFVVAVLINAYKEEKI